MLQYGGDLKIIKMIDNSKFIDDAFTQDELNRGAFTDLNGRCPLWTTKMINVIKDKIDFNNCGCNPANNPKKPSCNNIFNITSNVPE